MWPKTAVCEGMFELFSEKEYYILYLLVKNNRKVLSNNETDQPRRVTHKHTHTPPVYWIQIGRHMRKGRIPFPWRVPHKNAQIKSRRGPGVSPVRIPGAAKEANPGRDRDFWAADRTEDATGCRCTFVIVYWWVISVSRGPRDVTTPFRSSDLTILRSSDPRTFRRSAACTDRYMLYKGRWTCINEIICTKTKLTSAHCHHHFRTIYRMHCK